jgi:hypothetical protein
MLLWLRERVTKTWNGHENGHQRSFQPNIYANGSERCPVEYYKAFKSHRPVEMNIADASFFLAVRHGNLHQNNNIWYMKYPLDKNEIGKFLSKAAQNSCLQRDGGKLSNHSVRKTSISRLLDANTPEILVAKLSGHKNLQSLQSFKSASEQHQMSSVFSRIQPSAQNQTRRALDPPENLEPTSQSETHFGQLQSSEARREDSNNQAVFACASTSSISECQFQIFNGPVKIFQEKKRRRLVIESDEED